MKEKKSICVFCGSSGKVDDAYRQAATQLGTLVGEKGFDLVYGGGHVGLMGLVADAALASGSSVLGVIPKFLQEYEVGHDGLDELIVTDNMHDRKRLMYERSDAFVILPGGLGTLDETFEVLTGPSLPVGKAGRGCEHQRLLEPAPCSAGPSRLLRFRPRREPINPPDRRHYGRFIPDDRDCLRDPQERPLQVGLKVPNGTASRQRDFYGG